jgi:hypothetical protein
MSEWTLREASAELTLAWLALGPCQRANAHSRKALRRKATDLFSRAFVVRSTRLSLL